MNWRFNRIAGLHMREHCRTYLASTNPEHLELAGAYKEISTLFTCESTLHMAAASKKHSRSVTRNRPASESKKIEENGEATLQTSAHQHNRRWLLHEVARQHLPLAVGSTAIQLYNKLTNFIQKEVKEKRSVSNAPSNEVTAPSNPISGKLLAGLAFFLGCKLEEIHGPLYKHLISAEINVEEVVKWEGWAMEALEFKFAVENPYFQLQGLRILKDRQAQAQNMRGTDNLESPGNVQMFNEEEWNNQREKLEHILAHSDNFKSLECAVAVLTLLSEEINSFNLKIDEDTVKTYKTMLNHSKISTTETN